MGWWRAYYYDARTSGGDRTKYWRWEDIPADLISKWDAEQTVR